MLLNQLCVLPTPETRDYFSAILSASPLDIDIDSFHVEIMTTGGALETYPGIVYKAYAGTLSRWYDANKQESSLILPLVSEDMQTRFEQLKANGTLPYWFPRLHPHLVLIPNVPASHLHTRGFVMSISTTLATNEEPLTFTNEFAITIDQKAPVNYDYNVAQDQVGGY